MSYYNDIRSYLNVIYAMILNEDKYLRKIYYNYKELLLQINSNSCENLKESSFITRENALLFVERYLKTYFEEFYLDFKKTNIEIYDIDILKKYISASNDIKLSREFKNINLTKGEASALITSFGCADFVFNNIQLIDDNNVNTALTLIHEYTHIIHNKNSNNKYTASWYVFSEYLAYYNQLLFKEYLESLNIDISCDNYVALTNEQINLFKLMNSFYHGENISNENLEIIITNIKNENIPLCDYEHIIAFIASITKYEETRELSLYDRVSEVKSLLKENLNKFIIKDNYLDIRDRETVKKLIKNYNK